MSVLTVPIGNDVAINFSRGSYYMICRTTGDYMKYIIGVISALLFSSNSFSANELLIDNSRMTLILDDGNQANVSSCSDYVSLRKAGETIKDIPDLSEPYYGVAKAALTECYISAFIIQHQLVENKYVHPSLNEILHHLPASEKLIVSDQEMKMIKSQYTGKSIWDTSPDLTEQDDILVSKSDDTGYRLMKYSSYTGADGKKLDFLTLSAFSLHGTFGKTTSYVIKSKDNNVWDISKIDENSPL